MPVAALAVARASLPQAGYDAGDETHYLMLPGSGTAAVLDLTNLTNTPSNVSIEGLWVYAVRNGHLPGTVPDNPLMPMVVDDGWRFDFNIGNIEDAVFIDPLVAIGYDYVIDSGANFASVQLPTFGDGLYDLWLWDDTFGSWVDADVDLMGGLVYDFGGDGVDAFRILGIESGLGLDPYDSTAFVTGLWFTAPGPVSMRQIPIAFETGVLLASVPLPGALALLAIGLLGLIAVRRRGVL